jgi:hypothetical protein
MCATSNQYSDSFQHGKTSNLLWPVNATDQWNCLLHNQL